MLLAGKSHSTIAIVVTLVLIIPFCVFIKDFSWNQEISMSVPESGDSMVTREYILEQYDDGVVYPYELVISATSDEYNIFSEEFHNVTKELIDGFLATPEQYDETSYLCANYFHGHVLTPNQIRRVLRDPMYK